MKTCCWMCLISQYEHEPNQLSTVAGMLPRVSTGVVRLWVCMACHIESQMGRLGRVMGSPLDFVSPESNRSGPCLPLCHEISVFFKDNKIQRLNPLPILDRSNSLERESILDSSSLRQLPLTFSIFLKYRDGSNDNFRNRR